MSSLVINDKNSSIARFKREGTLDGLIIFEIVIDDQSEILEFFIGQFNIGLRYILRLEEEFVEALEVFTVLQEVLLNFERSC